MALRREITHKQVQKPFASGSHKHYLCAGKSHACLRRKIRRALSREIERARASRNRTQKMFLRREMTRKLASGNVTQPSFLK